MCRILVLVLVSLFACPLATATERNRCIIPSAGSIETKPYQVILDGRSIPLGSTRWWRLDSMLLACDMNTSSQELRKWRSARTTADGIFIAAGLASVSVVALPLTLPVMGLTASMVSSKSARFRRALRKEQTLLRLPVESDPGRLEPPSLVEVLRRRDELRGQFERELEPDGKPPRQVGQADSVSSGKSFETRDLRATPKPDLREKQRRATKTGNTLMVAGVGSLLATGISIANLPYSQSEAVPSTATFSITSAILLSGSVASHRVAHKTHKKLVDGHGSATPASHDSE